MTISKWEHPRHKQKHKQKNETALLCFTLFSLEHKHRRIITSISTRKTNMFVFLVLMLVLMRLCLCLCASENSIRQIGGFLLIFLFTLLTLMSRVFSLVTLMLCLCASENFDNQLYDCDDLDTSFLRPLRKIIWLQSCEQSSYETIPCKVRYDNLFVQMNIAIRHVAESRDISCRSLAFRCTHFVNFLTVVGLNSQFFPLPSLNEKHETRTR